MSEAIMIETAEAQRREYMDTKPQDRYAGQLKFTGCRLCGSPDRMQAVHRDTLVIMEEANITVLAPWFSEPGNDEYLFFPCRNCNQDRVIPDNFIPVTISMLVWAYCDPMLPDYAALAAEPVAATAGQDSHASARLEE